MSANVVRLLAVLMFAAVASSHAAVPNDKAVPAYAEEQTILQLEQGLPEPGLASSASGIRHFDRHFIVPPGRMTEQDVILQRGGNTWRELRNGPIAVTSAVLIILVLVAIALFYRFVGPSRVDEPETGRRIVRFTAWQRLVHWTTAIAFVLLALTGLVLLFGKKVLLPWMGHDAFSWVAIASKWLHNIAGPLFVLFSLVMFVTFFRQNLWRRYDWLWMRKLGGMVSREHVPADYANAGEKVFFWFAVTAMGLVIAVSGLMLNFPYLGSVGAAVGLTRYLLQWADYIHIASATVYIAVILGHAYLGTLGTPGAWTAMRYGTVDETWARRHHSIWYDRIKHRGATDAPRVPT
jgi:formate dehydrogenase subunit gamma